jgi:prepilin-type N-terminal cleavage/methylation domain-containing protein
MNIHKKEKGFTIIEVVLVLAIAGLIFMMVFIALPALQRGQRDTARKSEVSTLLAQITSYQSNNRGAAPSINAVFASYLDGTYSAAKSNIELPSGTTVTKGGTPGSTTAITTTTDNIIFIMGAKCNATTPGSVDVGTTRQAAALIMLENGDAVYCQTN